MIIVVGGIKGGSGKTNISTNLTVMRTIAGKRVLLIDTDEQESSFDWAYQRELEGVDTPWTTIQSYGEAVSMQVEKMKKDYDDIIIDTGGRDTMSQRSALIKADKFLIPFYPRTVDLRTLRKVKSLITECAAINTKMKSYALVSRADPTGTDNDDTIDVLKKCTYMQCLPFLICQRKSFGNAAAFGLGIVEFKPEDKKAISEMQNLYDHIYKNDCK